MLFLFGHWSNGSDVGFWPPRFRFESWMPSVSNIKDEIDRVWPALFEVGPHESVRGKWVDEYKTGDLPDNVRVERLRLDFESAVEDDILPTDYKLFEYGKLIVLADLEDLIQNGDTISHDSLLKGFDGAIKRGKQPESVNVTEAVYYSEYKVQKETVEYTVWLLLGIEW